MTYEIETGMTVATAAEELRKFLGIMCDCGPIYGRQYIEALDRLNKALDRQHMEIIDRLNEAIEAIEGAKS